MEKDKDIKHLLEQLSDERLDEFLSWTKGKQQRSQKKYKTFREEYAEIVRRCATRKPPRRTPPIY